MTTSKSRKVLGGLVLLSMVSLLGACSQEITAQDLRNNPTPELQSMSLTTEQRNNRYARMIDTNFRQIPDDIDQILLLDRPVRFSPRHPIP